MEQTKQNLEARRRWIEARDAKQAAEIETIPRQPEQIAYLAGLFGGEGCICVSKVHTRQNVTSGLSASHYAINVTIRMCNEPIIRWIHEQFAGTRVVHGRHKNPKWSDFYTVTFREARGVAFLKLLYPYLMVKKEQAALFFKFIEVKKQARFRADSHRAILLEELYEKVRSFSDRRGKGRKTGPKPKQENQGAVQTERCALVNDEMKFQSGLVGDYERAELVTARAS